MGISYNVYANDGLGGAVNYTTPIANTTTLSFTTDSLPLSSDTTFAVRAVDSTTGLEEANTDARVRVLFDRTGQDISGRPNPPNSLMARATAGGGCLATWGYNPVGQGGAPTGFRVYLTQGTTASYSAPAITIPYTAGTARFSCQLTGLADGVIYVVAVRATNTSATEGNTAAVAMVVGDSTPPGNVDGLTATATFTFR